MGDLRGTGHSALDLHLAQHSMVPPPLLKVTSTDLDVIRRIYELAQSFPPEHELRRAIRMYSRLRSLPQSEELRVLALFSVIELLVSHAPKQGSVWDSITHQVSTKLPMLAKFWNVSAFAAYTSIPPRKLWQKLYAYRSLIAHGGDANKGELKELKDHATVLDYLERSARTLVRYGLNNAEFLADLKQC